MTFDIILEGPASLLQDLRRFLGNARDGADMSWSTETGSGARMTIRERGEARLDARLLDLSRWVSRLEKDGLSGDAVRIRVRNLAYSEPYAGSEEFSEPFSPVPSLTIRPWKEGIGTASDPRTIDLDPLHAFGTGKHPTTLLCLRFLEALSQRGGPYSALADAEVLDFGCGTGILSLAAVKLGAARAVAVEIDPDAAAAARRNAVLNGLQECVEIREGSWETVTERFDLVLANVVAGVLFRAAGEIPRRMKAGGRAVASGVSVAQAREASELLEASGLRVERTMSDGGWWACSLR